WRQAHVRRQQDIIPGQAAIHRLVNGAGGAGGIDRGPHVGDVWVVVVDDHLDGSGALHDGARVADQGPGLAAINRLQDADAVLRTELLIADAGGGVKDAWIGT